MKIIIAASLALAAVACGASGTSTSSQQVSAISISPDPCAVGRTATQQMTATATLNDGNKQSLSSAEGATWSSANTGTATVSSNGVVVGVNAGVDVHHGRVRRRDGKPGLHRRAVTHYTRRIHVG